MRSKINDLRRVTQKAVALRAGVAIANGDLRKFAAPPADDR
jgi:hypothetical protein